MKEKYFDDSGDKKYFTIIPNYIANHSTANDQALYFQMKRLAGENDVCKAGYRYFVKKLGIGYKAFKKSREYLLKKKWISYLGKKKITTDGGLQKVDCYKVNDIWKINNQFYKGGIESKRLEGGVERKPLNNKVVSKENKVVSKGVQGGAERKQKKNNKNNKNIQEFFEKFYLAYPKKKAKPSALKAFKKINPNHKLLNFILKDIERKKKSEQWLKNSGQYIPYPATYLNNERWNDEEDNKQSLKDKIYGYIRPN